MVFSYPRIAELAVGPLMGTLFRRERAHLEL